DPPEIPTPIIRQYSSGARQLFAPDGCSFRSYQFTRKSRGIDWKVVRGDNSTFGTGSFVADLIDKNMSHAISRRHSKDVQMIEPGARVSGNRNQAQRNRLRWRRREDCRDLLPFFSLHDGTGIDTKHALLIVSPAAEKLRSRRRHGPCPAGNLNSIRPGRSRIG